MSDRIGFLEQVVGYHTFRARRIRSGPQKVDDNALNTAMTHEAAAKLAMDDLLRRLPDRDR